MLKNRLAYLTVTAVLFWFIYLHERPVTYTAFYVALLLPALSYLSGLRLKRKLVAKGNLKTSFIPKEAVAPWRLSVSNLSSLPCGMASVKLKQPHPGLGKGSEAIYFSIEGHGSKEVQFQMEGRLRGVYDLEFEAFYYDMLGLFKFRLGKPFKETLIVAPKIHPIQELEEDGRQEALPVRRQALEGEDFSSATGLREFQLTDSYRHIHWKASAKRGELISKTYQEAAVQEAVFIVENRKGDLEQEDLMMDFVASAMSYALKAGYKTSLNSLENVGAEPTADFSRLYREAAEIRFSKTQPLAAYLKDYLAIKRNSQRLYLFSWQQNQELLLMFKALEMAGHLLTVFVFEEESAAELALAGISAIVMKKQDQDHSKEEVGLDASHTEKTAQA